MKKFIKWLGRNACWMLVALAGMTFEKAMASPIESGQYFTDFLSTNNPVHPYYFDARPNDTVLVRVACEDALSSYVPDITVYSDLAATHKIADGLANAYTMQDLKLNITTQSWHAIHIKLPMVLANYSNNLQYSVSILRMPDAPLSHADLDVGPILSGQALAGTIHVGADLDAAMIAISNSCRMQIRMGQGAPSLVPSIQVFDPNGNQITADYTPEYRAEITTAILTNMGIYTVACSDFFKSRGAYVLSIVKIPGELEGDDPDIGWIINGETKSGTIDKPGDLDVAFFTAITGDVISVVMQKKTAALNPVMELYGPDAELIAIAKDPLQQQAAITNLLLTTTGKYTLILKDAQDRHNVEYDLTFNFISGPSTENRPETPTGLVATDGTYTNYIRISWDSAEGALGYDLWRSHGTNPPAVIVTNHNSTVFQDYDVIKNTTYYYKVKSRNTYGVSTNFSNTDSGWCGSNIIPAPTVRKAVLVGINKYSPGYPGGPPPPLQLCVNDAYGIKQEMLLGDPSNLWAEANISMFTDRQAAKNTLRGALNALAADAAAGDLILYTHASHGGRDGTNTLICAYDNNYYDYEMAADLARFRSDTRVVIILDTCHSGGMFKQGRPDWPFVERVMANYTQIKKAEYRAKGLPLPRDLGANIAFMTACAADEFSMEQDDHGLYTGSLLAACLKAADVDTNGCYSFKELHDYAAEQTTLQNTNQHPQHYNGSLLADTIARGVGLIHPGSGAFIYNDYDADGASDLALYHEASGTWYIGSLARYYDFLDGLTNWEWIVYGAQFGGPGWLPVAGDYDGDGYADATLYNEQAGQWMIASVKKMRILFQNVHFGGMGLRPVVGDYDGDGISDGALYARYNNGFWYVLSAADGATIAWGQSITGPDFTAVPGDYDGDGVADYALYHNASGYWYILSHDSRKIVWGQHFGAAGYCPVSGDYDGDGIFDLAVYHPISGRWSVWSLAQKGIIAEGIVLGGFGWQPVPGDYDGDGAYDFSVYHAAEGRWKIRDLAGNELFNSDAFFPGGLGAGFTPVLPTLW